MKNRCSKAKKAIISAVSLLAVSSAFIAPAYYNTDIFCSITASAADETPAEYFDFSDGEIKGLSDKGKEANLTELVIPEEINGVVVTAIGVKAFFDCKALKSVTLSEGLKLINMDAFSGCEGLTSIVIPDSVTSIGYGAFSFCDGLKSVTLPKNLITIEEETFLGCALESIKIPDSVTSIGKDAFMYCNLKSVTIPESVTSIGDGAFWACNQLVYAVILCNASDSIGKNVFFDYSDGEMTVYVPEKYYQNWNKKLFNKASDTYSEFWGKNIALKTISAGDFDFINEFTIKHKVEAKEGYKLPDTLSSAKFTYQIKGVGDVPELNGGEFIYNENTKEFTGTIDLTKADFSKAGDYWYEITESASAEIENYNKDSNTYYLHVIASNNSLTGQKEKIGVSEVYLNTKYDKNIAYIKNSNLKFTLPEGFVNGVNKNESPYAELDNGNKEYQVGYYSKDETDMDFYVYAWKNGTTEDGLPETAESAAKEKNFKQHLSTAYYKVEKFEDSDFDIYYYMDDEGDGILTHILYDYVIDDGEGNLVLFVFWLDNILDGKQNDEAAYNAQKEMAENIIKSLKPRQSGTIDTLTGTIGETVKESDGIMGDTNCDNDVNMGDVVLVMQSIANPSKYGIKGSDPSHITSQGIANSDVTAEKDGLTNMDALVIQKYLLGLIKSLPETK